MPKKEEKVQKDERADHWEANQISKGDGKMSGLRHRKSGSLCREK